MVKIASAIAPFQSFVAGRAHPWYMIIVTPECDSKCEDVVQHRPRDFNHEGHEEHEGRRKKGKGRREKEERMDKIEVGLTAKGAKQGLC